MNDLDRISLKGLGFEAVHGVYEAEKQQKQPFCVNIDMWVDTREAAKTDDLALSVDYSKVYARVRQVMEGRHINLLETLASRIADAVLADERIKQVTVEVEKCRATYGEHHFTSAVAIERRRL